MTEDNKTRILEHLQNMTIDVVGCMLQAGNIDMDRDIIVKRSEDVLDGINAIRELVKDEF